MEHKYLLILLAVLLIPVTTAEITVYRVNGLVNGESVPQDEIDKDGGTFTTTRKDVMKMIVTLKNNDVNLSNQAKIYVTIYDINNGENVNVIDTGYYTIDTDRTSQKSFSYTIPDNTGYGEYDLELDIRWRVNDSSGVNSLSLFRYTVLVEKPEVKEVTINEVMMNVSYSIMNLSKSCDKIIEATMLCFGYINRSESCVSELSSVKEERGTYKQKNEDCTSTLESAKNSHTECSNEKSLLEQRINNEMITRSQCNNQTASAVNSANKAADSKLNTYLVVAAIMAVGGWYYFTKRKPRNVSDSYMTMNKP